MPVRRIAKREMRLFIATSFPPAITRELGETIESIKPKLAAASWVRPDAQHLTFAFLGDRDEEIVEPLSRTLAKNLRRVERFAARLYGCGFFPNPRRARVGWIGLDPEPPFVEVAVVVRDAVTLNGIELDRADFKPHLTLMRMRDHWPPACIDVFQRALGNYASEPFVVDRVTLYASRLHPKGAVHTPVREFELQ